MQGFGRSWGTVLLHSFLIMGLSVAQGDKKKGTENSIGVRMAEVPAGNFLMGSDGSAPSDYDEFPMHRVRLSSSFRVSAREITAEQFKRFRMDYQAVSDSTVAEGMSWFEAKAFCDWLSEREHKHYRLPTEAEWEYMAKLSPQQQEKLGLADFHGGHAEWTADFYGPYGSDDISDPKGVMWSYSRVVRGGAISSMQDTHADLQRGAKDYFSRPSNRASVTPEYKGRHRIGFRIVEVEGKDTGTFLPVKRSLPQSFVLSAKTDVIADKKTAAPWFHVRPLLPVPPENMLPEATEAAGLSPALLGHMHSAGAAACENGDVIWIAFSSLTPDSEYSPSTVFVISRLRHGSDSWDIPAVFYDFADVNEQSAMLWNDAGTLHFFGGGVGLAGVPFREQSSKDCGANWSEVHLPILTGQVGGFTPQPITSAFRGPNKAIYVATDSTPDASMLWTSDDEGKTWADNGQHTRGRHTAFVTLRDGSILGMGGKNTQIDGYMPQFRSWDGGKTWKEEKTIFPALNVNQRPTILRLQSGRLFFACDWQNRQGKQPQGVTEHGALVALSKDEGKTWKIKTLPGVLPHEAGRFRSRKDWSPYFDDYGTIGYTVATQSPDGMIHLVGSMTHPSQEFEMNEAWILSKSQFVPNTAVADPEVREEMEKYPSGRLRSKTRGVVVGGTRYVLDGEQAWFFEDGSEQYRVTYSRGVKVGKESMWHSPGHLAWTWKHDPNGLSTWTQYWENGNRKHVSHWKGAVCEGEAASYNTEGALLKTVHFKDGDLVLPGHE